MAPTAIRLARRGVDGAFSDVPWIRLIGIALSCRFISLDSVLRRLVAPRINQQSGENKRA
jgi:hypothetical protein